MGSTTNYTDKLYMEAFVAKNFWLCISKIKKIRLFFFSKVFLETIRGIASLLCSCFLRVAMDGIAKLPFPPFAALSGKFKSSNWIFANSKNLKLHLFQKDSLSNRVHLVRNLELTSWKFCRAASIRVSLLFVSENIFYISKLRIFQVAYLRESIFPPNTGSNLVHSVLLFNIGKCVVWWVVIFRSWYLS